MAGPTPQAPRPAPVPVCIAIGSNLGDRRQHIEWAVTQLGNLVDELRTSRIIETEPEGVPDAQPPYLNAVVVGTTSVGEDALLVALLSLEQRRGRERLTPRGARTLDLDLIFYGQKVIDRPGFVVPHPRFRERRFVLEPLAEIAPEWLDPVTGKTVGELLNVVQRKRPT